MLCIYQLQLFNYYSNSMEYLTTKSQLYYNNIKTSNHVGKSEPRKPNVILEPPSQFNKENLMDLYKKIHHGDTKSEEKSYQNMRKSSLEKKPDSFYSIHNNLQSLNLKALPTKYDKNVNMNLNISQFKPQPTNVSKFSIDEKKPEKLGNSTNYPFSRKASITDNVDYTSDKPNKYTENMSYYQLLASMLNDKGKNIPRGSNIISSSNPKTNEINDLTIHNNLKTQHKDDNNNETFDNKFSTVKKSILRSSSEIKDKVMKEKTLEENQESMLDKHNRKSIDSSNKRLYDIEKDDRYLNYLKGPNSDNKNLSNAMKSTHLRNFMNSMSKSDKKYEEKSSQNDINDHYSNTKPCKRFDITSQDYSYKTKANNNDTCISQSILLKKNELITNDEVKDDKKKPIRVLYFEKMLNEKFTGNKYESQTDRVQLNDIKKSQLTNEFDESKRSTKYDYRQSSVDYSKYKRNFQENSIAGNKNDIIYNNFFEKDKSFMNYNSRINDDKSYNQGQINETIYNDGRKSINFDYYERKLERYRQERSLQPNKDKEIDKERSIRMEIMNFSKDLIMKNAEIEKITKDKPKEARLSHEYELKRMLESKKINEFESKVNFTKDGDMYRNSKVDIKSFDQSQKMVLNPKDHNITPAEKIISTLHVKNNESQDALHTESKANLNKTKSLKDFITQVNRGNTLPSNSEIETKYLPKDTTISSQYSKILASNHKQPRHDNQKNSYTERESLSQKISIDNGEKSRLSHSQKLHNDQQYQKDNDADDVDDIDDRPITRKGNRYGMKFRKNSCISDLYAHSLYVNKTYYMSNLYKYLRCYNDDNTEDISEYVNNSSKSYTAINNNNNNTRNYFYKIYKEHFTQSIEASRLILRFKPVDQLEINKRKVYLPKRSSYKDKKTLIFDLDETLIHCNENISIQSDIILKIRLLNGEIVEAGINIRPYAIECLKQLSKDFEIIIFTASDSAYANAILDYLDPFNEYIHHRLYREHCVFLSEEGIYIKDLRILLLNRSLKDIIIIDNALYSFGYQLNNGIPIIPYYDNKDDNELKDIIPYIMSLKLVNDIRNINKKTFKLYLYNMYDNYEQIIQELFD